jgi:Tfp pilus assembly protein PilF
MRSRPPGVKISQLCNNNVMAPNSDTFSNAVACLGEGRVAEAEKLCRLVVAADPLHADAWHLLGHIASLLGQPGPAEECLRRAIEINPRDADAYHSLGGVYMRGGALDRAADCFQKALELEPSFAAAYLILRIGTWSTALMESRSVALQKRRI